MKEVQKQSLAPGTRETIRRLTSLLGQNSNIRVFCTDVRKMIVMFNVNKSVNERELVIEVADNNEFPLSVALILADQNMTDSQLQQTLDELSGINSLFAIPANSQAGRGFSPVGRMEQRFDETIAAEYLILKREPGIREQLVREAPVDIGEDTDNLGGRENWFAKRHDLDN